MRIGILTLPLHTNYGGILQAYALQTVLERMGHDAVVIDKSVYKFLPWYSKPFIYGIRIVKRILGIKESVFKELANNNLRASLEFTKENTRRFISLHIRQKHINSFSEIMENDFDAIIVGSDQIWRTVYAYSMMNSTQDAYLKFASKWKNLKRIAYAASFGTDEWEYSSRDTKACTKLIKKFNAVSVREISGVDICRKYLDYNKAIQLIDPTMLLSQKDYEMLFLTNSTNSRGDLLCYILDETEEKNRIIEEVSESKNLTPFNVNAKVFDPTLPREQRIQPPVEQWLRGFYDAKFVITDSFHACVFAILFRKPFLVVGNKSRGYSRFESLLSSFGLKSRLISIESDYMSIINEYIDYDSVHEALNGMREKAFGFLSKNLN